MASGLVVGNVNDCGLQPVVKLAELRAHLHPEFGIQVREGLIHEEDLGLPHNGSSQSNPLSLSAGESFGLAIQKVLNAQDPRCLFHPPVNLSLGELPQFQAEGHVVVNVHMGIEGIVLKHHGDIPIFGRNIVD